MSDAPSAPPREGVTVTPPRATRIPPLDPETPESQAPNPHHASNNAGPGQQPQRTGGFGATGAASSEAMPPKRDDEEDAEQQDALVNDVNRTHVSSDTPAADVAAVARLARDDDRTRADADEQRDEPAEDEPMAESGDEREAGDGREADLADEPAHDESAEDTDADERDVGDEAEDEDMADPGPERWSFLDLRGGHHALDVYHEVGLVVSRFASFSRASAQDDIGFRLDSRENSPPDGTKSDPTRNQTFSRILRVSRRSDRAAAWTAPPTATRPPRRPHAGATSRASPGTACSSRASGTARSGSPSTRITPTSRSTSRAWTRCARPCERLARTTRARSTPGSTSVSGWSTTSRPSRPTGTTTHEPATVCLLYTSPSPRDA